MTISTLKTILPFIQKRSYTSNTADVSTAYKKTNCLQKACSIQLTGKIHSLKDSKFVRNHPSVKHLYLNESYYNSLDRHSQISYLKEYKEAGVDLSVVKIGTKTILKNAIDANTERDFTSWYFQALLALDKTTDYLEYEMGSPLHDIAYFQGTAEYKLNAIRALLEEKIVPVDHMNNDGDTPLSLALQSNFNFDIMPELIELFFEYGAIFDIDSSAMEKAYRHYIGVNSLNFDANSVRKTIKLLERNDKKIL